MRRSLVTSSLLLLSVAPARADFSLGGQYMQVSRTLEAGGADLDSDAADALALFVGWDWRNSMFYIQFSREEAEFSELLWRYEKEEVSFDWHWNETTAKDNFVNVSAGVFYTSYAVPPGFEADFLGLSAGGGLTRFVAGPLFFNARARLRIAVGSEEELFPSEEADPQTSFYGYEAQAALGLQLGRKVSWSVQVGYKFQLLDFEDRFIDDRSQHAFLSTRVFVPSGK